MIFSAEINGISSIKRIIEGDGNGRKKTATCRAWKDGNYFADYKGSIGLYNANGRILHYVGQECAVVSGRTKPTVWYSIDCIPFFDQAGEMQTRLEFEYVDMNRAKELWQHKCQTIKSVKFGSFMSVRGWQPARIRILAMSKIDVRKMTEEQAYKEGFDSVADYLVWWFNQSDPVSKQGCALEPTGIRSVYSSVWGDSPIMARPVELYTGVFYEFEMVEE